MNKDRIRFRQKDYHLSEIDNFENINWCIEKYGCGPTSIANILVNLGFDIDPIYITKKYYLTKTKPLMTPILGIKG